MRHVFRMLFLVLAAIAWFGWMIVPPEKQLRLGKDLRGGVSMIYTVAVEPGEDPESVIARTIDVLKRRVDPNGVLEIAMVRQGRDRIEITMPLPSERVKALRKEFEDALGELGRAQLSPARLQSALDQAGEARTQALTALAAGSEGRKAKLLDVAKKFDTVAAARESLRVITSESQVDQATRDQLEADVATSTIAFEEARENLLSSALSASEIRKVVQASTRQRKVDDATTGQLVSLPSAREVAEAQLRAKHADSLPEVEKLLALHANYSAQRTTLDDPQDLVRMLRGAGVLSFRITVAPGALPDEGRLRQELREKGPRGVKATDVRWFRINQIENWIDSKQQADALATNPDAVSGILNGYIAEHYSGDYYMLCYDTRTSRLTNLDGNWRVARAYEDVDQRGRPAIAFEMDPAGAQLLSRLTGSHVRENMAVLLDDQVYTAPTLQSEIGARGQISGDFDKAEREYVIRVLGGGSLQAKLSPEPISISSVGPELGADNLQKGFSTALFSAALVAAFMIVYYFGFGAIAVVALLVNALLILGAMGMTRAAFTMPGIAGVILTFGMAVDSNVLIYERMREEFGRGADMKTAVRLGFEKALSAIVDGNVTNLIVCVVLYYTGTPEIRGFAITMGIGVIMTLFAALVVTRVVFELLIRAGWKKGSMLPMAVPGLQRALTPNIDWMKYRYIFFAISAVYVLIGLGMIFFQGSRMLDNEFRGGTQVTLQFREEAPGKPLTMTRSQVEERVFGLASQQGLADLRFAEIIPINPQGDGVTSDKFTIKTTEQNTKLVLDATKQVFQDKLEAKPALQFAGSTQQAASAAPVFAIDKPILGANIGRAALRQDVQAFVGGAAIVLDNISPSTTLASLTQRLETSRQGENYSDTLARSRSVVILEGTEDSVQSAAILVADDNASVLDNEQRWELEVRDREWALAQDALTKDSTPASVQSFSAAIAETFTANAITAMILSFVFIGIYIWVRFSTPRYSLAAIVALVHDVLTVIGLLALAEILYESPSTQGFASAALLLPFKIDLNMVAALLTIAGYSLNDTVVIMDRIRENRGKLPHASRDVINTSINQTFSRTLITGGTTLGSCVILYIWGGEGMRAFAFALATGLIVGTYSSVAVAAPIVWSRKHDNENAKATSGEA
jgi:SecD/SecF fusion protein